MGTRQVPVQPYPDVQQKSELDGVTYVMRLRWNERAESWHLDLSTLDDEPIASGVRLVPSFPLLRRNQHPARPPGELYLLDNKGLDEEPTLEEFGTRFILVYVEAA
jgi:uncharacterized protein DUF6983